MSVAFTYSEYQQRDLPSLRAYNERHRNNPRSTVPWTDTDLSQLVPILKIDEQGWYARQTTQSLALIVGRDYLLRKTYTVCAVESEILYRLAYAFSQMV